MLWAFVFVVVMIDGKSYSASKVRITKAPSQVVTKKVIWFVSWTYRPLTLSIVGRPYKTFICDTTPRKCRSFLKFLNSTQPSKSSWVS